MFLSRFFFVKNRVFICLMNFDTTVIVDLRPLDGSPTFVFILYGLLGFSYGFCTTPPMISLPVSLPPFKLRGKTLDGS